MQSSGVEPFLRADPRVGTNGASLSCSVGVLDLLQEGIWISDSEGRVVFASSALAKLLGYRSPEALVGRDWRGIFPAGEDTNLVRTLSTSDDQALADTAVVTRDGQRVPVRVKLVRRAVDGENWLLGALLAAQPGSSAAGPADPVSRQVMEHSTDGICVIYDGRIGYVNPQFEKLTGYTLQQMAQIGLERLIVPSDRERVSRAVAGPSRMLAPVLDTVRLVSRSAREIDCEFRVVTAEANGHAIMVCFLRDVSELSRARKARTDFVAVVSHELRTPLAAIKEAVSLVSDSLGVTPQGSPAGVDRVRRYLSIAQEEIARLNRMISNLLEVSRMESGKLQLALGAVDLRTCVGRTVESMATLLNKKRLEVDLRIPDDLPSVLGDEDRLRLVFNNLLDNAIKYTPTGSTIVIAAQSLDPEAPIMSGEDLLPGTPYVQVSFADSGPGIPAEFLERVFGRYERVDPHGPGVGLGLAIARSVVETHHGRIWVRSELGEGTCFNLILPVKESR